MSSAANASSTDKVTVLTAKHFWLTGKDIAASRGG